MIKGYPGSKTASGMAARIVSLMPRHDRYVEPFLGGGIILESKRPARSTIAADADGDVVAVHRRQALPGVDYRHASWAELLPSLDLTRQDLVYLDPPYHPSTRCRPKLYRHEMSDVDHRRLLRWCLEAKANVMISGYRCALYDQLLAKWHRADFQSATRGGPCVESVWCNFTPGETFHDTRWLGGNYRERERIKRKRSRWLSRFSTMAAEDRAVIWEALEQVASTTAALTVAAGGSGDRGGARAARSSTPAATMAAVIASRGAAAASPAAAIGAGAGSHHRGRR